MSKLPLGLPSTMPTNQEEPLLLSRLLDRAAIVQPDNILITKIAGGYTSITYAEHQKQTYRVASSLFKYGIRLGDRIGTFMWNNSRHMQLYHAVPSMGAVLHTINIRLHPRELKFIINHAGDRLIFVDENLLPLLERLNARDIPTVEKIVVCGDNESAFGAVSSKFRNVVSWESFIANGDDYFEWPIIDENSACGLCYTSGTTGEPKGVLYSHRSTYLHTLMAMGTDTHNTCGRDTILMLVPMFHVLSWGIPFVAMTLGARYCLINNFMTATGCLEFIIDHGVSLAAAVPTVWAGVRSELRADPMKMDKLKRSGRWTRLLCGGTAPPPALIEWYGNELGIEFIQGWGMTETNPLGTQARHQELFFHALQSREENLKNQQSAGILRPGLLAELRDTDDITKKKNADGKTPGDLIIKGPWVTRSYFKNAAPQKFIDGYLITGDVATLTPRMRMNIVDRSKDLIKSGGEWISSKDMENWIMALDAVKAAIVVGVHHPYYDERPIAIVELEEGASITPEEIVEHVAERFAKFQLPDDVLFWDEIPLTGTGKSSKLKARTLLQEEKYELPAVPLRQKMSKL